MTPCSFLSTSEKEIECFKECAFYNWEENEGSCPFKNLTGNAMGKFKDLFGYELFNEDEMDMEEIDEYYDDSKYIE